jgi:hypothetical protein
MLAHFLCNFEDQLMSPVISTYKFIGSSRFPLISLLWKGIPNGGLLQLVGYFHAYKIT